MKNYKIEVPNLHAYQQVLRAAKNAGYTKGLNSRKITAPTTTPRYLYLNESGIVTYGYYSTTFTDHQFEEIHWEKFLHKCYQNNIPEIGTRVKLTKLITGCTGPEGCTGVVVSNNTFSKNGLLQKDPHFSVKLAPIDLQSIRDVITFCEEKGITLVFNKQGVQFMNDDEEHSDVVSKEKVQKLITKLDKHGTS